MNRRAIIDKFTSLSVLALLAGLVVFLYFFGSVFDLGFIAVVVGTVAGLVMVFVLYHQFNQEKTVIFPSEEKVLLTSSGNKSYVVFVSIGDQDFPLNPISADIYLTNIGILAEPPGSGESILYIPHYRITEFVPYAENAVRIRYFDVNDQFSEVVLHLQNRQAWTEIHMKILAGGQR